MKAPGGRTVEPEWLDELPPQDPRAIRSRRDLRRLNKTMKHPEIMARNLFKQLKALPNPRVVELGAGDGNFLLNVVRQAPACTGELLLVDQVAAFDPEINDGFNRAGWRVKTEIADVFGWLGKADANVADAIVCNLFLHHFRPPALAELLRLAARCTNVFIGLEPRRSWFSMLCGRFLWCIGCGPVTRHDAAISLRAGFTGRELSLQWPDPTEWQIEERPAGLFSHIFIARQIQ